MVLSMERWIGKVAVVTGASSGIGAGIVVKLVEEGLVVVGLARRIDRMEIAARELSGKRGTFHPIKCDLSVENEIIEAFENIRKSLGPVHVLINNAGFAKMAPLVNGETEKWKAVLDVNLLALCICTREAIKDMNEHNIDGHIIHVNSVLGHRIPDSFPLNVYPATKRAVGALAEVLRFELNDLKSNIKITSLSPGLVSTEIFDAYGVSFENVSEALAGGNLPCLNVEAIVDGVVYILSTPPKVMVSELTIRHTLEPL
ncbi:unnamed protein product [Psylliodes chrysocephalus]|uniref:Farnesol dehydrogenase-like n=1 Tax=Psylliodes chrysocephalus TaxID=3402493 RepID=A0A9P0GCW0_9CUCU|nr:unnamed protein product [Psylliodes chrysocephala]